MILDRNRSPLTQKANIARRHHVHPGGLQKAFKTAVLKAGIIKQASVHTLSHSFATHLMDMTSGQSRSC